MWLKRGLCGLIDLRSQTVAISGLYCFVAMIGLVYGFVMIESPEKVFGTEHAVEEVVNEEVIAEEEVAPSEEVAESIRNGTLSPHERHFYDASLVRIQKQGVKTVVTCLVTLILSIMLGMGAKQGKSLYFVPWLTEQIIALCVGATTSLIMALGGTLGHVTVVGGVIMLLVFLLDVFFVYSIFSHFILLRRMKRHSKEIISSVMQGNGYQTSNYDRMTEELGREMTVVPPGRARGAPDDKPDRDDVLYFSI